MVATNWVWNDHLPETKGKEHLAIDINMEGILIKLIEILQFVLLF